MPGFQIGAQYRQQTYSAQARTSSSPLQFSNSILNGDMVSTGPSAGSALEGLIRPETSEPSTVQAEKAKLDVKIREILNHGSVPEPTLLSFLDSAPGDTAGDSGPEFGSEAWYARGIETGLFFPMPISPAHMLTVAEDGRGELFSVLVSRIMPTLQDRSIGGIREAIYGIVEPVGDSLKREMEAYFAFATALFEVNELMRRIVANNPGNKEKIMELGRIMGADGPQESLMISRKADSNALEAALKKKESFFNFYYRAFRDTKGGETSEVFKELNEGSRARGAIGRIAGDSGMDLLMKSAKDLELDVFEDTGQASIDINIAIIEASREISGSSITWTQAEREQWESYLSTVRELAKESDGRAQMFDLLDGVAEACWHSSTLAEARALLAEDPALRDIELTQEMFDAWKENPPSSTVDRIGPRDESELEDEEVDEEETDGNGNAGGASGSGNTGGQNSANVEPPAPEGGEAL